MQEKGGRVPPFVLVGAGNRDRRRAFHTLFIDASNCLPARALSFARHPPDGRKSAQCVYLVLLSCSFFLKGMSGLTVTIGSMPTLAALM